MIVKNPSDIADRKQRGRQWIFDNLATSEIAGQIETMYKNVSLTIKQNGIKR
jgi:hypothetical protein